jgi:hypothetical protein
MFIADDKKHNIFVIEPGSAVPTEYFHSEEFNQPSEVTSISSWREGQAIALTK